MGDAEDVPDAFAGGRLSTLVQSTNSVVSAVSVAYSSSMVPFEAGCRPSLPRGCVGNLGGGELLLEVNLAPQSCLRGRYSIEHEA